MRIPKTAWILIGVAGLAGIVAAGITLFEWNMLRHPLAGYISARVGRSINIDGDLLALRGPILVDGSFKSPNLRPATGSIAARAGASVALGVLATPFAALVPLVDPGGATNADCPALIQEAHTNVSRVALEGENGRKQRRPG